jgi:3-oxoacyl-[acyl-carrier protein] reductase
VSVDDGSRPATLVLRADTEVGAAVAGLLGDAGHVVVAVAGDADRPAIRDAAIDAAAASGRLGALVLPPPVEPPAPAVPWSRGWMPRVDAALRTAFFVTQRAAPNMTGGRIALAAPARRDASAAPPPATTAEGAFVAMIRLLAVELAPRAIAVNGLCPIASDADARDVAASLAFLCSPGASYMTGSFLPVGPLAASERP